MLPRLPGQGFLSLFFNDFATIPVSHSSLTMNVKEQHKPGFRYLLGIWRIHKCGGLFSRHVYLSNEASRITLQPFIWNCRECRMQGNGERGRGAFKYAVLTMCITNDCCLKCQWRCNVTRSFSWPTSKWEYGCFKNKGNLLRDRHVGRRIAEQNC